jgi:phosphatidate cytidylyltransferase
VAVGLSLLGLAGDLLMSAWKRDAGVKDSGQFLPGQGGLLDRLDSFLVTAPVFFYALGWLS